MVDNSLNWEQESTDIYNEISKIFNGQEMKMKEQVYL